MTREQLLRQAAWYEGLAPSMPDYAAVECLDIARECRAKSVQAAAEELLATLRERAAI